MKRWVGVLVAAAFVVPMVGTAMAQSKTVSGEAKVVKATVEAIEELSRTLTIKLEDGTYRMVTAAPELTRFSEIKIGDKINARYYENVVVRVKQPGEKDVNTSAETTTSSGQAQPGGTAAKQRTITATVTAIDQNVPSITFTGPNGWKYSSKVEDKKVLAGVKVGDKVDIVWTEALLLSVDAPGR